MKADSAKDMFSSLRLSTARPTATSLTMSLTERRTAMTNNEMILRIYDMPTDEFISKWNEWTDSEQHEDSRIFRFFPMSDLNRCLADTNGILDEDFDHSLSYIYVDPYWKDGKHIYSVYAPKEFVNIDDISDMADWLIENNKGE
jgi:hypothetical protein